jgi:hypothetical protein
MELPKQQRAPVELPSNSFTAEGSVPKLLQFRHTIKQNGRGSLVAFPRTTPAEWESPILGIFKENSGHSTGFYLSSSPNRLFWSIGLLYLCSIADKSMIPFFQREKKNEKRTRI